MSTNSREYIVLHHTADPTQGPQFDKVNASHKARGFPISKLGYYVGYHYFIGYEGTIKVARYESEIGAHCDAKNMNYRGIGICLAGDFSKYTPNKKQIEALAALVRDIKIRNQIPDQRVLLHRECKPTACPGTDLRRLIKEVDSLLAKDVLLSRLEDSYEQYQEATKPSEKNRLRRLIERIKDLLATMQKPL